MKLKTSCRLYEEQLYQSMKSLRNNHQDELKDMKSRDSTAAIDRLIDLLHSSVSYIQLNEFLSFRSLLLSEARRIQRIEEKPNTDASSKLIRPANDLSSSNV